MVSGSHGSHAKGKSGNHWIKGAIKHPGSLTRFVKSKHMGMERGTEAILKGKKYTQHRKKQARFERELEGFHKHK